MEKDGSVHHNGNNAHSSAESNASSSSIEFSRSYALSIPGSPTSLARKLNRKRLTAKVNPESSIQRTCTTADRKSERKHHRKRTQSENNHDSDIPVDDPRASRHAANDTSSAHQHHNCEVTHRDFDYHSDDASQCDIQAEIPKLDIRGEIYYQL